MPKTDERGYLNILVDYVKSKYPNWVRVSNDDISRIANVSIGSRSRKLNGLLRLEPHILYRYIGSSDAMIKRVEFKYEENPEQKKNIGIRPEHVAWIPESEIFHIASVLKRTTPDFSEQLIYLRILDLLYRQVQNEQKSKPNTTGWFRINIRQNVYTSNMTQPEYMKHITALLSAKLLIYLDLTDEYHLVNKDMSETDISQMIYQRTQDYTSKVEKQTPPPSGVFHYLKDLNAIQDSVCEAQKRLSQITMTLNHMVSIDENLSTSTDAFKKTSEQYSNIRKENIYLENQLEAARSSYLKHIDKIQEQLDILESEPLSYYGKQALKAIQEELDTIQETE